MSDPIDELARQLQLPPRSNAEVEMQRRQLLASVDQPHSRAALPRWVLRWLLPTGALAAVAALALIVWNANRSATPTAQIAATRVDASNGANYSLSQQGPNGVLHVVSGRLSVTVPEHAVVIATIDTSRETITAQTGAFELAVAERQRTVRVFAGRVTVAADRKIVEVVAPNSYQWDFAPTQTAAAVVADAPPPTPSTPSTPSTPPTTTPTTPTPPTTTPTPPAPPAPPTTPPTPALAAPTAATTVTFEVRGLTHFRSGRDLLAAGKPALARKEFELAARTMEAPQLVEDAQFWAAVAAHRSQAADANAVLLTFATQQPHSPRAGQVALLLAQRAVAAGDRAAAERWLPVALADPLVDVKQSAEALAATLRATDSLAPTAK